LTKAAAAILAAEPGDVARAVHPVLSSRGWGTRVRARLPTSAVASAGDAQRARELAALLGKREVLALITRALRRSSRACSALLVSPRKRASASLGVASPAECKDR
jgi:hypothetical protein